MDVFYFVLGVIAFVLIVGQGAILSKQGKINKLLKEENEYLWRRIKSANRHLPSDADGCYREDGTIAYASISEKDAKRLKTDYEKGDIGGTD